MNKALIKINAAREFIRAQRIKKDAANPFSKYEYFSPEYISKIVFEACKQVNAATVFNLKRDELGFYGELIFADLESGDNITTIMRTEKPTITATNETQQFGGMATYSKRYCLQSLFDIEDNSLDFDGVNPGAAKNAKAAAPVTPKAAKVLPALIKDSTQFNGAVEKMKIGASSIEALQKYFTVTDDVKTALLIAAGNNNGRPMA